jgi:hypothetical protein
MYSGTVTGVRDVIEFTRDVEDKDIVLFHAALLGVVQGMIGSGYHVTNVVTTKED